MEAAELIKHLSAGTKWFNNGKTRSRYVVGLDGMFIYYKSKPTSKTTTGVLLSDFAKWAKGVNEKDSAATES